MKKFYLLFLCFSILGCAQNKAEAEKKIREGVTLYDAGKYDEALSRYNEALNLDKNNFFALAEKAMTLEIMKKYDESIEVSELVLKLYPKEDNATVYVTYGNALDHIGKSDLAIKAYNEGIKKYPDYYHLYFNKGIALYKVKETEKAVEAFQITTRLNPNHAGSYNALAVIDRSNRIPSILAAGRYLILDNKSSRAKGNLETMLTLMKQGISKSEDNSINVSLSSISGDKTNNKKSNTDDFSTVDIMLSMSATQDLHEENKDKTEIQKFIDKFSPVCRIMKEVKPKQKGYYWDFLAPYFIEMNDKNLLEPFANIIFLAIQDKDAIQYNEQHQDKIKEFYNWSKNYNWK